MHITVPGTRDCAVFGIPDEEYGTPLRLPRNTKRDPVSAEAGHDFLRPHLASYEIPKRIEGQSRVRIPARIFKRKLRDQYWETQRRQI